jgi:TrpR-related protein YerC/YecD
MMEKSNKARLKALFKAISLLGTPALAEEFLVDLCTPAELIALADRWRVADLLAQKIPYREIQEMTGVSTATVTRVARAIRYGTGGYKKMLQRKEPE